MPASGTSPTLVHRFAEFAIKLINGKLEPLFAKHMKKFDQEYDDMQAQGETLEQYEAFKEYEEALERELTVFVRQEGFEDEREFMKEVTKLVEEDRARVQQQLMELVKQFEALLKTQEDKAKGIEIEEKSAADVPKMMMFFAPQGLEEMLKTVMSLAEYTTFSVIMRSRVQQQKLLRMVMELQQHVEEQLKLESQPVDEKDIEVENIEDDDEEIF